VCDTCRRRGVTRSFASVSLSFVHLAPLQAAGNAALQADPCDAAKALEHYTRALALLCWFGAVPLAKEGSHTHFSHALSLTVPQRSGVATRMMSV